MPPPVQRARPQPTLADYAVIAISPALIMLVVGSLVFFLIEVFYSGEYDGRLNFIMAMFVMGAVLIARIAIENGREYAMMFAVPLGLVTAMATFRFVEFRGPLQGLSTFINIGLIGLIWWCADKLTWDSTVIDESRDASAEGLLHTVGLDGTTQQGQPADAEATTSRQEAPVSLWRKFLAHRRRPHAPGVWVIYFSLAALPIFGFGNWFVPADDLASRRYVFKLLVVYVAAALGLLVTTSFLGLRRYLRQRRLEMPIEMAATWLGTGAALIVVLLALCLILPRRNPEYSVTQLPLFAGSPSDLWTTEYAVGNEGQEDPEKADRTGEDDTASAGSSSSGAEAQNSGSSGSQRQSSGQQSGNGAPQKGPSGNTQSSGQESTGQQSSGQQSSGQDAGQQGSGQSQSGAQKSGSQGSGQDGSDADKSGRASSKGEGNEGGAGQVESGESAGQPADSSEQDPSGKQRGKKRSAQRPKGQRAPSNEAPSDQDPDDQRSRGEENDRQEQSPESSRAAEPQPVSRFDPSKIPQALGGTFGQLMKLIYWAIVIAVVGYLVWRYHAQIAAAVRNFLASLRAFWESLMGRGQVDATEAEEPLAPQEIAPAFAAFANPFLSGMVQQQPPANVIRYSFQALEAWAREQGFPRDVQQTPHEFAAQLGGQFPWLARDAAVLAELYSRCAYGGDTPSRSSLEHLRKLWDQLQGALV